MKVHEQKPDEERLSLIDSVSNDAANYLGVKNQKTTPLKIMEKINKTIEDLVFEKSTSFPDDEEPHVLLGALWGTQMQRQFNWYWSNVVIDDDFDEVATISPEQEMIIFPFSFVGACLNKQCVSTLLLAFNMLMENKEFSKLPQGGYENIMLGIHHIVPPYTLEKVG